MRLRVPAPLVPRSEGDIDVGVAVVPDNGRIFRRFDAFGIFGGFAAYQDISRYGIVLRQCQGGQAAEGDGNRQMDCISDVHGRVFSPV